MEEVNKLPVISYETPMNEIIERVTFPKGEVECEAIEESLKQILIYSPFPVERESKEYAIKELIDEWFSQKMQQYYPEISPEIWGLRHEIEINLKDFIKNDYRVSDERVKVEIPLLARANPYRNKKWTYKVNVKDDEGEEYEIIFSSEIPKIPKHVRDNGKKAVAYAHKVYTEALETEVIGDLIYTSVSSDGRDPLLENLPFILVAWKPRPEDLKIEVKRIDRDPALFLKFGRSYYLVDTWREPTEEPWWEQLPVKARSRRMSKWN